MFYTAFLVREAKNNAQLSNSAELWIQVYTYMQNRAEFWRGIPKFWPPFKNFKKVKNHKFLRHQSFKIDHLYMKMIRKLCALSLYIWIIFQNWNKKVLGGSIFTQKRARIWSSLLSFKNTPLQPPPPNLQKMNPLPNLLFQFWNK